MAVDQLSGASRDAVLEARAEISLLEAARLARSIFDVADPGTAWCVQCGVVLLLLC